MINGISGRPGSGKSYEAVVRHILPALQDKRKVVTNIPLNVEWFCNVIGLECRELIVIVDGGFHNYGQVRYFSEAEHFLRYQDWRNEKNQGVFFVVDECHLSMPAKSTDGTHTQRELKEYLSMHRHYGHDVLLLSQNFRKVDRDIRDMIQNCYYTIKKTFLGQDDKYILKVADGVSRNIVVTYEREYEPQYFPAYQSHTKSQGSVQEAETVDVPKWYKNKHYFGSIALFLLAPFIIWYAFSSKQETEKKADEIKTSKVAELHATKPPVASTPQLQPLTQQTRPAQPAPEPEKPKQKEEKEMPKSHPLDGLYLTVTGFSADWTRSGHYQKLIYIAVSRNGQMLKEITSADLALAGYQLTVLNDCMVEIKYKDDYRDWLFCDTPTQTQQLFTGENVSKAVGG